MAELAVRHYIDRAEEFYLGMQLMRDDEAYLRSTALLAIHSAIAFTDALRIALGSDQISSDDHGRAVDSLRRALPVGQVNDTSGFAHLQYLLARKSLVAYGDHRLTAKESENLVTRAERFAKWTSNVWKQLNLEEWT